tara:strand:+ start:153 stop:3482 length:3330 start_codon:yes stop_codon:yes gene_type:complete
MNKDRNRKIYVYTTESGMEKGWYKIGETTQDVGKRVRQQDGTSNAETLNVVDSWDSPVFSDREFHDFLKKEGYSQTRVGREWYEVPGGIDQIKKLYNKMSCGSERPNSYKMRPEQQECHDECIASFEAGDSDNRFLFACVMRFGKTFTAYQAMKTLGCSNALILTAKPEVCTSWREDLEQHVDFEGYNFIDLRTTPKEEINFEQKNVFFSSFQYLEAESSVDKAWILGLGVDLVMVDEEHYGCKTDISGEILSHFETARQIHISGTPYKSWRAGLFKKINSYFYTYKDSQLGSNPGPRMSIYALNVAQEVAKAQRFGGYTGEDGFHIAKLFAAVDGEFENESYVECLMKRVFDPENRMSKSAKLESPLRMKGVNKRNLDHILLRVPNSVDSARALYTMLNRILGDYEVILAAGQGGDSVTNVQEVKDKIAANKKTVTITCGRFETGVTIPELGAVFLFDGGKSPESYNQMNFRGATPHESDYWNKEEFYVFDFDPHRTLELVYVTSMMDKEAGQDMESVLGEFFEVAPVLVQAGVKFVQVKPSEVIDFYNTSISDMSTRFASEWCIKDCYDAKALAALSNISAWGKKKIERIIADNPDLEKGKLRKLIVSSLASKSDKDKFKKTRQKLQAVLKRLPIAITVLGAVDLDSLLASDSSIFQDITGVTTEEYKHFLDVNIIDRDWQKDCIQHTSNKLLGIGQGSDAKWEVINLYCNTTEASPGTPRFLANGMLDKLPQEIWSDKTKTFCDPAFANGSFYFLIIDRLMEGLSEVIEDSEERLKHIIENQVFIYDTNEVPRLFVRALAELQYSLKERNIKPNICYNNLLEEEISMKFDVWVQNPPYQVKVGPKKTEPIWQKFVKLGHENVKDGGYILSIHPSGWRAPKGRFSDVKELYLENQILSLTLNGYDKGSETFGVGTAYDTVVLRKSKPSGLTSVVSDGKVDEEVMVDLTKMPFIPNGCYQEYLNLLPKVGEESTNVLYSRSAYGTDKENTSSKQGGAFTHPCIYTVPKSGPPRLFYSSTDQNGHFGVPKVIWSNGGASAVIVDSDGDYGMAQFSYAIADEVENLPKIKEAMEHPKFLEMMSKVAFASHRYNYKVISCLRKDWWKSFVN